MIRRGLVLLAAIAVVAVVLAPAGAVLARAAANDASVWERLFDGRLTGLFVTSVSLAAGAAVVAGLLGVLGAWLTVRFRFPARGLVVALLASPLAVPPYVTSLLWLETTSGAGPLAPWLEGALFGQLLTGVLLLGLCTSPLVFLVVRAALGRMDSRFEDAAASLGHGPLRRIRTVVLPLLRPALVAGLCLVILYALADFGAVSVLGLQTFTRAIFFEQLNPNRAAAWAGTAALATVLLVVALPPFLAERAARGRARFETATGQRRVRAPRPLGPIGQVGAWLLVLVVAGPTTGLVISRSAWLALGLEDAGPLWERALVALGTSAGLAAAAATVAIGGALLVAWCGQRLGGGARWLAPLGSVGYVLPGPVVALGALLVVTGSTFLTGALYGTMALLVLAWVVRFLPEALQAADAGLGQASPRLEEAARMLGSGAIGSVARVTLPIVRSSLVAGWVLVFAASLRELPATLLLKPPGLRTLPLEIWSFAEDSFFEPMAPFVLLLVVFGVPIVALLLAREDAKVSA